MKKASISHPHLGSEWQWPWIKGVDGGTIQINQKGKKKTMKKYRACGFPDQSHCDLANRKVNVITWNQSGIVLWGLSWRFTATIHPSSSLSGSTQREIYDLCTHPTWMRGLCWDVKRRADDPLGDWCLSVRGRPSLSPEEPSVRQRFAGC